MSPALACDPSESVSGACIRLWRIQGSVAASKEDFASGAHPDSRHSTHFVAKGNRICVDSRKGAVLSMAGTPI